MIVNEGGGPMGSKRLQAALAQFKERNKKLLTVVDRFGLEIEAKLRLEEEEMFRSKEVAAKQLADRDRGDGHHMEEEEMPDDQAEIENDDITEHERYELEARVLGLDFPDQFPSCIDEQVFARLRADLYNKDKLNDAVNFNVAVCHKVYSASIMKGFNSIDIEESVKYFREHFDLDLRDNLKNVATIENTEIKPTDMFRLAPMVFLNDTTINFYIKIISKYFVNHYESNDFHFFNTYFCSMLRTEISNMALTHDLALVNDHRFLLQEKMEPVKKKLKNVS